MSDASAEAGDPGAHNNLRPVVLVTSRSFSSGTLDLSSRLEAAGLEIVRHPHHELSTLGDSLPRAVAWIAGTAPVTAAHFAGAPRLKVLARYGVGCDAVDLAAADKAGVVVTNTPGANSDAVAEYSLALMMAVLRGVPQGDVRLRAGDWSVRRGRQLGSSTVGIVGFGRIGQASAALLTGLGCHVMIHDPYVDPEAISSAGYQPASLDDVRVKAKVVTFHSPGGPCVINEDWLADCAPGQVIVNTARASLIDEAAVAAALREGRLFGYAADTLQTETDASGESPLLAADLRDRVVLTPHLGAQTDEAVDQMGAMAVDGALAVLADKPPSHPVRFTPPAPDSTGGSHE